MSTQYEKQAKAAEATAKGAQKDLDERREILTAAEVERDKAEVMAMGGLGEEQIKAQTEQEESREARLKAALERLSSIIGEEDPERAEQLQWMLLMMEDPTMSKIMEQLGGF
jgi:hypothetical protein